MTDRAHTNAPSKHRSTPPPPPLVVVQGFLCSPSRAVWGDFERYFQLGETSERRSGGEAEIAPSPPRRILFPRIGPVSSLHDRACELFYALRGGLTDYGVTHALQHGHAQYGRTISADEALYPLWNACHPVHFLTHSLGGPTVLKLQQLLRDGFFDDALGAAAAHNAADAILSITAVSAPFHGTPLVYLLGSQPSPYPQVRFLSAGDLLAKAVHLVVFLETHMPSRLAGPLRRLLDPHADAWSFARRRSARSDDDERLAAAPSTRTNTALAALADLADGLRRLGAQLHRSDWAEGRDCAPWDCTLHARDTDAQTNGWASAGTPNGTYYRSLATYMTHRTEAAPRHYTPRRRFLLHGSPLALSAWLLGSYDFDKLQPAPAWWPGGSVGGKGKSAERLDEGYFRDVAGEREAQPDAPPHLHGLEAWYANDGVVPLASQFHPGPCGGSVCTHARGLPGLDTLRSTATQRNTPRTSWTDSVRTALRRLSPPAPRADEETPAAPRTRTRPHLRPGVWEVHELKNTTHASLMPLWMGSEAQCALWVGMGEWCVRVEREARRGVAC